VANASWRRTLGPLLRGHAMTKLSKGKEVPSKKVSNSLMPALRASCQLSVTKKGTSTPPCSKEASRGKNGTIVATVAHSDLLHEKPYWK